MKGKMICIRLTAEEREKIGRAANAANQKASIWAQRTLLAAADAADVAPSNASTDADASSTSADDL